DDHQARASSKKRRAEDGDNDAMDTENGATESTSNAQHVVNLEDLAFAQ
ncbi:unnamed protein product, partial [Rotaria magnacalcarata]